VARLLIRELVSIFCGECYLQCLRATNNRRALGATDRNVECWNRGRRGTNSTRLVQVYTEPEHKRRAQSRQTDSNVRMSVYINSASDVSLQQLLQLRVSLSLFLS